MAGCGLHSTGKWTKGRGDLHPVYTGGRSDNDGAKHRLHPESWQWLLVQYTATSTDVFVSVNVCVYVPFKLPNGMIHTEANNTPCPGVPKHTLNAGMASQTFPCCVEFSPWTFYWAGPREVCEVKYCRRALLCLLGCILACYHEHKMICNLVFSRLLSHHMLCWLPYPGHKSLPNHRDESIFCCRCYCQVSWTDGM